MSDDCKKMRDVIAGSVADATHDRNEEQLRAHLDFCAACRNYLRALQQEDKWLTGYFAAADADTPRRRQQVCQAIERVETSQQTDKLSIWRGIMRSRLSQAAIAAAILLAVAVGVSHLGGRLDGTGVAWAGVAERLGRIQDYTYRQRQIDSSGVETPGFELKQEWEMRCYYSCQFGSRWDQYGDMGLIGQYYTLLEEQQLVHVYPGRKTFKRRSQPLPQTMPRDPIGEIRQILAEPCVKLGRTTIDGVLVEGIEVQGQKVGIVRLDDAVSRLWVNVETELPVQMEAEGKRQGSDAYVRFVRDQFQWNAGLTQADLTPVIPADFTQEDWPADNGAARWDAAVAAAEEPMAVDFSPLEELGLLNDDPTPQPPAMALTGMKAIQAAQDEVMSVWPKYTDLRNALRQELDQKLNLESCSVDDLVGLGILLREKYWDAGGDLSPTGYRYGYMARVLLELAHAQEPNDLTIGDELVETIMSVETMRVGEDFWPVLRELRAVQFRRTCAEVEHGRQPAWVDFARGCDLTYLWSNRRGAAEGVHVVDWLIEHAQTGGWTAYLDLLEQIRSQLAQGRGLGYNIYTPAGSTYPEEFRYGGRLPSFRGPAKRAVIPAHPLEPRAAQAEK